MRSAQSEALTLDPEVPSGEDDLATICAEHIRKPLRQISPRAFVPSRYRSVLSITDWRAVIKTSRRAFTRVTIWPLARMQEPDFADYRRSRRALRSFVKIRTLANNRRVHVLVKYRRRLPEGIETRDPRNRKGKGQGRSSSSHLAP